jgi:hypothetical protein
MSALKEVVMYNGIVLRRRESNVVLHKQSQSHRGMSMSQSKS